MKISIVRRSLLRLPFLNSLLRSAGMAEEELLGARLAKLQAQVAGLRRLGPPVGTIVAYAGPWPPVGAEGVLDEQEIGWMLCDGRPFQDTPRAGACCRAGTRPA
jgi:hypothetical protein